MKIEIEIPDHHDRLQSYNDQHLAFLWHVAQHNPAPIDDAAAGEFTEHVGREIIRRWLGTVPPALWNHQGRHHYWDLLQKNGKWLPVDGNEEKREWVPNRIPEVAK